MNLHKYLFSTSPYFSIPLFFLLSCSDFSYFAIVNNGFLYFYLLFILFIMYRHFGWKTLERYLFFIVTLLLCYLHNVFQCWRKHNNRPKIFERRRIFIYFNYYLLIYLIFFRIYLLAMFVFFNKTTSKVHSPNLQLLRWYNNRSTQNYEVREGWILVRKRHRGTAEKRNRVLFPWKQKNKVGVKRGGETRRERQKSHRGKLVDIPRLYRSAE